MGEASALNLSRRGENASKAMPPAFVSIMNDPYSDSNPAGYLSLGIAENVWLIAAVFISAIFSVFKLPRPLKYGLHYRRRLVLRG
jgi:hypothetical protein